jgi:hypothetical protein
MLTFESIKSIAAIHGDLSNITAPPFVLATQSTVEFPAYWAEHTSLFLAPATEPDPVKRALLVLRWYLTSLRNQQYGGRDETEGVKKPLNAFLGELFLASWDSEEGKTRLVSEQVSHHPPVTACCLWNEESGIRAEGYTRQEISFSGSVNVKQIGHAILHIDAYDEDYLIPLPNVKVKGILSGTLYPELHGQYHIVSSSGFVAEIDFSGKGFLSGKKNSVDAILYREEDKSNPLFTVSGQWNDQITIQEGERGAEIETIDVRSLASTPMHVDSKEEQDDWESRKVWAGVITALNEGDMQKTVDEKSRVEQAQRELRELEKSKGVKWEPLFFTNTTDDPIFEKLKQQGQELHSDKTVGVWKFDREQWGKGVERPFHGTLRPDGGQL